MVQVHKADEAEGEVEEAEEAMVMEGMMAEVADVEAGEGGMVGGDEDQPCHRSWRRGEERRM